MSALTIAKFLIPLLITVLILIQDRSTGMSGFSSSNEGSFYQRRRGMEKVIFGSTIILIAAFSILSIWSLVLL